VRKNSAALLGAAAVLIAIGFAAGYRVGLRRAVEQGTMSSGTPSRSEPSVATAGTSARPSSTPEPADADRTRETMSRRIADLEAELRRVREEPVRKTTDSLTASRLAFEDLLAMESGGDWNPERLRSLIDHLAKVDESCARHFIEMFRSTLTEEGRNKEQEVALKLALMSGGPDAAAFLEQALNDPSLAPAVKERLLSELAPGGDNFFSVRRTPVGDSLATTAVRLVHSDNSKERTAGVTLLGGVRSESSRGELIRLLEDSDPGVRQGAARSLGMVGDQTSRRVLESYAVQTGDPGLQKAAAAALQELDGIRR
jgi:hypothetical protein